VLRLQLVQQTLPRPQAVVLRLLLLRLQKPVARVLGRGQWVEPLRLVSARPLLPLQQEGAQKKLLQLTPNAQPLQRPLHPKSGLVKVGALADLRAAASLLCLS
jgi:hypothetical protein